jgi:hypothetical protein
MSAPITPERLLKEMRGGERYVSNLCVLPTTPKFLVMLADKEFAKEVEAIVTQKIADIENETMHFEDGSARQNTLKGWQNMLETIEKNLYPQRSRSKG